MMPQSVFRLIQAARAVVHAGLYDEDGYDKLLNLHCLLEDALKAVDEDVLIVIPTETK